MRPAQPSYDSRSKHRARPGKSRGSAYFDAKESARLEEFWLGLLAKNCEIEGGYQQLRKMIKDRDGKIWLNAEEALKFGIVDKIGIPKIKVSFDVED